MPDTPTTPNDRLAERLQRVERQFSALGAPKGSPERAEWHTHGFTSPSEVAIAKQAGYHSGSVASAALVEALAPSEMDSTIAAVIVDEAGVRGGVAYWVRDQPTHNQLALIVTPAGMVIPVENSAGDWQVGDLVDVLHAIAFVERPRLRRVK